VTESFIESWQQRFGNIPSKDFGELAPLVRHRSVRTYAEKQVSEELVTALVGAAQSAATSSNLQLWSLISIQDSERREEIAKIAGDQDQIRRAPWFFAFVADHSRLLRTAQSHGEKAEGLDYAEFCIMSIIDASLAAERFVCAAETLGLGICYIGAMRNNPGEIKRVLGLPDHTFCCFGLCLGWPEEPLEAHVKPRLGQDAIWFREGYKLDVSVSEYDDRMKDFYESEKMRGDVTWSMRSSRRVDNHHLTGREVLKPWLESQGFNRR
jgi:nitroreductase